jgi:DNA/RNA-binding domain of Phe-tRNA-synthetase-like protein
MKVRCAPEIFARFPASSIHGVVFDHVDLFSERDAEPYQLQALRSVQESSIQPEFVAETPAIKEWRQAYQMFGLKPSKNRSSIEQLFRRALKGELIQTPLPLVNLYCYVSLIEMIPIGGYDLKKTEGNIVIRFSSGEEEFQSIGESQSSKSEPGVVVYADEAGIICWGWNQRDSARTCLSRETQKAIFFADSATDASRSRAASALDILSDALSSANCARLGSFVLDRQTEEVTFPG